MLPAHISIPSVMFPSSLIDIALNMKEQYKHCLLIFTLLIMTVTCFGCNDDILVINKKPAISGDEFTLTGSIMMPGMKQIASRGGLGDTPNDGLVLTVFEFNLGDNAESSFLSNIYTADILENTAVDNGVEVKFNLTLKASDKPKVLHFMLCDRHLKESSGSVASILPSLFVASYLVDDDGDMDDDPDWGGGDIMSSGQSKTRGDFDDEVPDPEAYWGYVEFKDGYVKIGADGKPTLDSDGNMILRDDIASSLTRIPLIRNFAEISVSVADNVKNFTLRGFEIMNVPTSGTIAPWDIERQIVPAMLDTTVVNGIDQYKMKDYADITYKGIVPGDADFRNQESIAKMFWTEEDFEGKTYSRYMYEHSYETTRRTYIIVYGDYTWKDVETGVEHTESCFYKLDIGKKNDKKNNLFECYNIIRNIRYNVTITNVEARGCQTVEEAIDHTPFNNISASTETSSMLNISDGHNMLIVNKLNYIIVEPGKTIEVLYRYIENVDVPANKKVNNQQPEVLIGKGSVIKNVSEKEFITIDGVDWVRFTLDINNPTSEVETQTVTIVDNRGLGRTINLTLRDPWKYEPIGTIGNVPYYATVARNTYNLYGDELKPPEPISSKKGEEFTVYFNLPPGLKESMFPLDFYLESKYQGIENNKIGNLVVSTGPSLFNPNVTAISYIKRVTFMEYEYKYLNDNSTDFDISEKNSSHTIRCRFTTIVDAVLDNAEIRIHNPYFEPDISVVFQRKDLGSN